MDARANYFLPEFCSCEAHACALYNIIMDTMHAGLSIRQKMALDLGYYYTIIDALNYYGLLLLYNRMLYYSL